MAAGVAVTAALFFVSRISGLASPSFILLIEAAGCALSGLVLANRRRTEQHRSIGSAWRPRRPFLLPAAIAAVFLVSAAWIGIRLIDVVRSNPHGEWDASAIWNLRAKYLAGSLDWRFVISPPPEAHPDYPLLLSAFNARSWRLSGNMSWFGPAVTGLALFATLVALIVGSLAMIAGTEAAIMGGFLLLSFKPVLFWAPSQYADIPLACYFLGALALIWMDAVTPANRWALPWAGCFAGFAAWTKNEGEVFSVALIAAFFGVSVLKEHSITKAFDRWRGLLAGAAPWLILSLGFKAWASAPSDLAAETTGEALSKMADPSRYAAIAGAFANHLLKMGEVPGHPLILLSILSLVLTWKTKRSHGAAPWTAAIVLSAMLASYFAVYVVTPNDLEWHLNTSLDRLLLQVWPAAVLLFCSRIRSGISQGDIGIND
jgi:hypothetical protein